MTSDQGDLCRGTLPRWTGGTSAFTCQSWSRALIDFVVVFRPSKWLVDQFTIQPLWCYLSHPTASLTDRVYPLNHVVPYIFNHLLYQANCTFAILAVFPSSGEGGGGAGSGADWLNSNKSQTRDKVNSEMFAEIRSEPSLPVCIPCTARRDYFYLEDCAWYHFSKWESASAAWVIHLGSSDNFLWNMCVLFIPEGIPQHMRRDEYLWKGNRPGEQFVIKEILWKYIHKPLCSPSR